MAAGEDLELLAAQGDRVVILGSGQRAEPAGALPRDAGVHLVAGKARRGGLRHVAALPGGPTFLSPDYRWLGVLDENDETILRLYDTTQEARPGFCFENPTGSHDLALHPCGEMVACRAGNELQLLLPDGQVLRSATFPRRKAGWPEEAFLFSPCGNYLWFAYTDPKGVGTLFPLHCPSLEVLDSCPPTHDPANLYDSEGTWLELIATASPGTGHIALRREVGDDFLTLHFYTPRDDRIHLHAYHVYATEDDIPGERAGGAYFSPKGDRFLMHDSDDHLHEFSFPGCRKRATTVGFYLCHPDRDFRNFETFAYSGNFVLADLEGELVVLRSGDLKFSPLSLGKVHEVLANGMLLLGRQRDQQLQAFHLEPGVLAVVAELDSGTNRVRAVHHRRRGTWSEITAEVGWVELNFELADD
jgi:hypothetical protein